MIKVKTFIALIIITLFSIGALTSKVWAQGASAFLTGDVMTATNNTIGSGAWSDPVSGNSGEIIEFRIVAQNQTPGVTASNVIVTASLQSSRATTVTASGNVSASGFATASDNATVNVLGGSSQSLEYVSGHARVFSGACPSGCNVGDTVTSSGINVGNLAPGESAQVMFKAGITNVIPAVSPAPSPSAAASPAPSPSAVAQGATTTNCPAGTTPTTQDSVIVCVAQSQSQSQTVTQTNNQTVSVNQPAPAATSVVAGVKELPKTGLPVLAWAVGALLPLGYGLRKFGKGIKGDNQNSPKFMWERRRFEK